MAHYGELQGLVLALMEKSCCEVCRQNDWLIAEAETVSLAVAKNGAVGEERLVTLPAVCRLCGHIRLFSVPQLEAIAADFRSDMSGGNGHLA